MRSGVLHLPEGIVPVGRCAGTKQGGLSQRRAKHTPGRCGEDQLGSSYSDDGTRILKYQTVPY